MIYTDNVIQLSTAKSDGSPQNHIPAKGKVMSERIQLFAKIKWDHARDGGDLEQSWSLITSNPILSTLTWQSLCPKDHKNRNGFFTFFSLIYSRVAAF
jgi:hypothetical protein